MSLSVVKVLEDLMHVLYEDGMSVTRITLPQAMRNRLSKEATLTEAVEGIEEYAGQFKTVEIVVGEHFIVEVE